jgi:hypothetical protein
MDPGGTPASPITTLASWRLGGSKINPLPLKRTREFDSRQCPGCDPRIFTRYSPEERARALLHDERNQRGAIPVPQGRRLRSSDTAFDAPAHRGPRVSNAEGIGLALIELPREPARARRAASSEINASTLHRDWRAIALSRFSVSSSTSTNTRAMPPMVHRTRSATRNPRTQT